MNKDVTQSSFYKALCSQIESWSNEYPLLTKEHEDPSQQFEVLRKHYANIAVLYEITKRCLTLDNDVDQLRNKALRELREAFILIELQCFIQPATLVRDGQSFKVRKRIESSTVPSLFGLDPNSLRKKAKEKVTKGHLEILREEIQNYLLRQCNQIISFTFPEETFPPSDGMNMVVSHVSNLKKESSDQRSVVEKQRQYNSGLLKLVFQQLIEYGSILETLVQKHRFSSHLVPHLSHLSLSIKVYLLKLRYLEREILAYTYSKTSIPVLKRINEELDKTREHVTSSLDRVDHKLSAYQGLNPRFYELLQEFSGLQKDLQFLRKT